MLVRSSAVADEHPINQSHLGIADALLQSAGRQDGPSFAFIIADGVIHIHFCILVIDIHMQSTVSIKPHGAVGSAEGVKGNDAMLPEAFTLIVADIEPVHIIRLFAGEGGVAEMQYIDPAVMVYRVVDPSVVRRQLHRGGPGFALVIADDEFRGVPGLAASSVGSIVFQTEGYDPSILAGYRFFHGNGVDAIQEAADGVGEGLHFGVGLALIPGDPVLDPAVGGMTAPAQGGAVGVKVNEAAFFKLRQSVAHVAASTPTLVVHIQLGLVQNHSIIFSFNPHNLPRFLVFGQIFVSGNYPE